MSLEGSAKVGAVPFALAGICVVLAVVLSLYSMFLHLKNYRRPDLQRLTIRIFWMVPIYAIASYVSLSSRQTAYYIDTIRDVYEAFVIYSFFTLLINYLEGERALLSLLQERLRTHHLWPFHYCFAPMDMSDPDTFLFVRRGVLQFVILKPILAVLIMTLKVTNRYEEGYIAWDSSYLYLSLIYNLSVCWSMYCLVLFYVQCSKDLKPYRPMPKFICVKAIIFLTFWQGLIVAFLVAAGLVREKGEEYSANNMALALQDIFICFEMPFFALAHMRAFPWTDYDDSRLSSRVTLRHAIKDALGVRDLIYDTYATFINPPDFRRGRRTRGDRTQYREHFNADLWNEDDEELLVDGHDHDYGSIVQSQSRQGQQQTGSAAAAAGTSAGNAIDDDFDEAMAAADRLYFAPNRQGRLYLDPNADPTRTALRFPDPDAEEEIDYVQARELVFGDYNFPVVNEDPRYHHPPQVVEQLQRHANTFNDQVASKASRTREAQQLQQSLAEQGRLGGAVSPAASSSLAGSVDRAPRRDFASPSRAGGSTDPGRGQMLFSDDEDEADEDLLVFDSDDHPAPGSSSAARALFTGKGKGRSR